MTGQERLGELIRRRMTDYEYTVETLAGEIGMTTGGLYRIIEGRTAKVSCEMKYRLCVALDIAPRAMEEGMRGC